MPYKIAKLIDPTDNNFRYRPVNKQYLEGNYEQTNTVPNMVTKVMLINFLDGGIIDGNNKFYYTLERSGDVVQPLSLFLTIKPGVNWNPSALMTFIDTDKIIITLEISGTMVFCNTLSTIIALSKNMSYSYQKHEATICTDLPFYWLFGKFIAIAMPMSHMPKITIISPNEYVITKASMTYEVLYYENNHRHLLATTNFETYIQHLECCHFKTSGPNTEIINIGNDCYRLTKTIALDTVMRGFFIESYDIAQINKLELFFNGHSRLVIHRDQLLLDILENNRNNKYNNFVIPTMHFIPLNSNKDFRSLSSVAVSGGTADCCKFISLTFTIELNKIPEKFNIHVLTASILTYYTGSLGLTKKILIYNPINNPINEQQNNVIPMPIAKNADEVVDENNVNNKQFIIPNKLII